MQISKLHQINLAAGEFDHTTHKDLEKLFQHLQQPEQRDKSLIVHFHGGLVSQSSMEDTILGNPDEARPGLLASYQEVGYPLFFIWQTGLVEVLKNNLFQISKEKIFEILKDRLISFLIRKLKKKVLGEAIGVTTKSLDDAPSSDDPEAYAAYDRILEEIDEFKRVEKLRVETELKQDHELRLEASNIVTEIKDEVESTVTAKGVTSRVVLSDRTLMSPDFLEEVKQEPAGSKSIFMTGKIVVAFLDVVVKVIRRFRNGTHHGFYPTVLEELYRKYYLANAGKTIWDAIKKNAADAFGPDGNKYGGRAFLELLQQSWGNEPSYRPEIYLIAHSAGSIFVSHLIKQADKMGLPEDVKFNVIFLAPACTFELFDEVATQHRDRIKNIRLFALGDEWEQKDPVVPNLGVLYPRSLLYFVSGLLESETDQAILGMQRFFPNPGEAEDTSGSLALFKKPQASIVWSRTDTDPGKGTNAVGHSQIDDEDPVTMASIQFIIQNGYSA